MNQREYIREQVEACLALSPEDAAQRHIGRLAAGWNMQFGFLPFESHRPTLDEVVSEVALAIGFHVTQRSVDLGAAEIDAYSVGYERLRSVVSEPVRLSRGVGLWVPNISELVSGGDTE